MAGCTQCGIIGMGTKNRRKADACSHGFGNCFPVWSIKWPIRRRCCGVNGKFAAEACWRSQLIVFNLMAETAGDTIHGDRRQWRTGLRQGGEWAGSHVSAVECGVTVQLHPGHGHMTGNTFLFDNIFDCRVSMGFRSNFCLPQRIFCSICHHGGTPMTWDGHVCPIFVSELVVAQCAAP